MNRSYSAFQVFVSGIGGCISGYSVPHHSGDYNGIIQRGEKYKNYFADISRFPFNYYRQDRQKICMSQSGF